MSIPLVQNNEKDSINTSIIAIKRQIERINALLGLSNSEEIDTSVFATKTELEDAVTQVETDLAPVDEVTIGNMQSVTSNAVYDKVSKVETWTNDTINLYKIGKIVYGLLARQISGSSPFIMSGLVPWKPLVDCRFALINNNSDTYAGQFIIYQTGALQCYKGDGGTFENTGYRASFMYMTND